MQRFTSLQEMLASAVHITSGASSSRNVSQGDALRFFVNVTAASGSSPTLDITLEESFDDTNWFTLRELTQITATGKPIAAHFPQRAFAKYVRVSYTIGGGTPSFTFSVHMENKS